MFSETPNPLWSVTSSSHCVTSPWRDRIPDSSLIMTSPYARCCISMRLPLLRRTKDYGYSGARDLMANQTTVYPPGCQDGPPRRIQRQSAPGSSERISLALPARPRPPQRNSTVLASRTLIKRSDSLCYTAS